ncbi:hypothetical protein GDO86_001259 [Hymenochirus boettgeri]|uniref:RNA polymerase I subunit E n=1 Tax=Hymenochirus boettgeri TaxID=247094 RepID=A0A8T2KHH1_9PIPI|nr:hypothetical protein GDO86_001259 [Hymenochirus boettgeri]
MNVCAHVGSVLEMSSRVIWEYPGDVETTKEALLVKFSNGSILTPESVSFTLYKNKDKDPKMKSQRILAAETDRLSYAGNNFSSDVEQHNSLCRYFVGVLNKETGKMEVYDAVQYNMQPILERRTDKAINTGDVTDQPSKSYREKVDALIESFGTIKQKRALSSRKLNQVGSEILNKAMEKAAVEIIESKGTTELVKYAVDKREDTSLFLPPCDYNAEKPENAYKFDDLISPVEYTALEAASAAFRNLTPDDLQQMVQNKKTALFVLQELQELQETKDKEFHDHHTRCLWFLDALIKLSHLKMVKRKDIMTPECPNIIFWKLMKHFTVQTYRNGRMENSISGTMKTKIVSYVIALALHITDFQVDLTILQRDMKLKESRILEIAKAMGLKITKKLVYSESLEEESHKIGFLTIPLTVYKPPMGAIKRKRM